MSNPASYLRIPILFSSLALAVFAALSGCKQASTAPPTLEESVNSILPPALVDTLKRLGMVFNDGGNPPNLEGNFYANKKRLIGSNVASDTLMKPFGNMSMKFSGQTSDHHIRFESKQGVSAAEGYGAIITGTDDRFTVYVKGTLSSTRHDTTITAETAMCYSGRIDADGIHDLMNSLLFTRKDIPDPTGILLKVGQGRVIIEADSLAARVTDYPHDTTSAAVGKTGASEPIEAGSL